MTKNRGKLILSKRKIKQIAIATLAIVIIVFIADEAIIRKAEQSANIIQLEEYLHGDYSFLFTPEGWAEKEVMRREIKRYNKEQGYNTKEEMYTIYRLTEDDYWVTNEILSYREFAHTASDFYTCLGDMLSGIRQEKETFLFIYTNEERKSELVFILGTAMLSENLDIDIDEANGKDATIVYVTVQLKSSEKGGDLMSPHIFLVKNFIFLLTTQ